MRGESIAGVCVCVCVLGRVCSGLDQATGPWASYTVLRAVVLHLRAPCLLLPSLCPGRTHSSTESQGPCPPAPGGPAACTHSLPRPFQGLALAIFNLPQHSQVEGGSHLNSRRQSLRAIGRKVGRGLRKSRQTDSGPQCPNNLENRSRPWCCGAWNQQACPLPWLGRAVGLSGLCPSAEACSQI